MIISFDINQCGERIVYAVLGSNMSADLYNNSVRCVKSFLTTCMDTGSCINTSVSYITNDSIKVLIILQRRHPEGITYTVYINDNEAIHIADFIPKAYLEYLFFSYASSRTTGTSAHTVIIDDVYSRAA